MNRQIQNTLKKVANELALSYDKQTYAIFGKFKGYLVCLMSVDGGYNYTLRLSLAQGDERPDLELLQRVVSESKVIKKCAVVDYQVNYMLNVGMTMTAKKVGEKLREVLEIITKFLRSHDFQNCCQIRGPQNIEPGIYSVAGVPMILCEESFREQSKLVAANADAKGQKKESLISGVVGALLGTLIGVLAIVLLGQLGYVAVLSGIIMAVCALKGYELLGRRLSKKGIVISCILMVAMVYFGNRLDWSISVANYFTDVDIFTAFRMMPTLLSEGYLEGGAYYGNLALVYLFTAVGAIPTIINIMRTQKLQGESYKMSYR
ncbi:MAG: hypothetical protein QM793_09560 [Muricomes sp.]